MRAPLPPPVFTLLLLLLLLLILPPPPAQADISCNVAKEAMQKASALRKLSSLRSVPCVVQNQDEVRAFINTSIERDLVKERVAYEERVFKAIGFLPKDYDYLKGIIELYLSQIAGYYDPNAKRYVMAGWIPELMQPATAVHELTHALQDQHFNLATFIDQKKDVTDVSLARSSLVEGDATAVMTDYVSELSGGKPLAESRSVDGSIMQQLLSLSLGMGSINAPESLKFMLLAPYSSGLRFAHALLLRGGYSAITAAFRAPPQSTEQILHPEKYPSESPVKVEPVTDHLPANAKEVYRDTLGELVTSLTLAASLPSRDAAAQAAAGWGGDTIVLYNISPPDSTGSAEAVVWNTQWDNKAEAAEFCTQVKIALKRREKVTVVCDEVTVRVTILS